MLAQARRQRAIEAEERRSSAMDTMRPRRRPVFRWTDGDAAVPAALFAGMSDPAR